MKPAAVLGLLLGVSLQAGAFELSQARWERPAVEFHVALDETSTTGGAYNQVFAEAARRWTAATDFPIDTWDGQVDPCAPPTPGGTGPNTAVFSLGRCSGRTFSAGVLAVTVNWSVQGRRTKSTILFNGGLSWDAYDGPWQPGRGDLRRVAVHELGHALGLGHETDAEAVMAPAIGDVIAPLADDIEGIRTLYGLGPLIASGFEAGAGPAAKTPSGGWTFLEGDLDGDGRTEIVRYRDLDGRWEARLSASGSRLQRRFGGPGQRPLLGDFDGDGVQEIAVESAGGDGLRFWPTRAGWWQNAAPR